MSSTDGLSKDDLLWGVPLVTLEEAALHQHHHEWFPVPAVGVGAGKVHTEDLIHTYVNILGLMNRLFTNPVRTAVLGGYLSAGIRYKAWDIHRSLVKSQVLVHNKAVSCPTTTGKVKPLLLTPASHFPQQLQCCLVFHHTWNERKGWPSWSGKWHKIERDRLKTSHFSLSRG